MADSICCDCCAALASSVLAGVAAAPPVFNAAFTDSAFCCTVALCVSALLAADESAEATAAVCGLSDAGAVAALAAFVAADGFAILAGVCAASTFFPASLPETVALSAFCAAPVDAVSSLCSCNGGWNVSTSMIFSDAFAACALLSSAVAVAAFSCGVTAAVALSGIAASVVCAVAATGAFRPSVGKSLPRSSAALKVASSNWKL